MQAIRTKYKSPTNHRASKIKATAAAGSILVSWNYEKGIQENHAAAAKKLADKLGWSFTEFIGGTLPDESMAWVASKPGYSVSTG